MRVQAVFKAIFLGAVSAAGAATHAFAQGEGYAPDGIALGAFRASPSVSLGWMYDDNVYRTQTNSISDSYFGFGGVLAVESNWSQHMLNLRGSVDTLRYNSRSAEDRTNWSLGTEGRLDVQRGSALSFDARHTQVHEARNDPNTGVQPVNPVEYGLTHFGASAIYDPAMIGIEIGGSYDMYNYDDSVLTGGGVLDNSDRDRDIFGVYGTISYSPGPTYPLAAIGCCVLAGFHALFDFSLQMPAISLTLAAILGLGVAQAFSGREV